MKWLAILFESLCSLCLSAHMYYSSPWCSLVASRHQFSDAHLTGTGSVTISNDNKEHEELGDNDGDSSLGKTT